MQRDNRGREVGKSTIVSCYFLGTRTLPILRPCGHELSSILRAEQSPRRKVIFIREIPINKHDQFQPGTQQSRYYRREANKTHRSRGLLFLCLCACARLLVVNNGLARYAHMANAGHSQNQVQQLHAKMLARAGGQNQHQGPGYSDPPQNRKQREQLMRQAHQQLASRRDDTCKSAGHFVPAGEQRLFVDNTARAGNGVFMVQLFHGNN